MPRTFRQQARPGKEAGMTQGPFPFVHASDLHLERPLFGLAEVPDRLRDSFIEAPYVAAERVFETAIAEQADVLGLAGDILHNLTAGARAWLFLQEQFSKLNASGIQVYWAGGGVDPPEEWPAA